MHYVNPTNRHQLTFGSLEERVATDNPVRFIDAFVDTLDLSKLGFVCTTLKSEGRPPFHPKVFLKLYLYSYQNGLRSSRKMAKECTRNVELQWLIGELCPNYHSIADFRKINSPALRNTFKLFVDFLKHADLIGGEHIAIDGTKVRASNSKKNNYSPKKIERHLEYIEAKTNEYLSLLDANDQAESSETISAVEEKIARLKTQKIRYELLKDKLEQSGETQISTTDEDARALLVQGQVVEVSYNMQAAVDEKHKLVVATHTINKNDRNALHAIAKETQHNVGKKELTVLADKGYHNGGQLQQCQDDGISTIVAHSEVVNSNDKGTTPDYLVTRFIYNKENDTYICPQGETLSTKGTWHKKTRERDSYMFKKYRTQQCKTCPVKHLCTGRQKGGRELSEANHENHKKQILN
jgi:transposase